MTTVYWPIDAGFTSVLLTPANISAVAESPFTFEKTTYEFPGERWELEASVRATRGAAAEALQCVILKARQKVNYLSIPVARFNFSLMGGATGSIKVDGADQVGRTLNLKDAPTETTVFAQGDYFNLGNRLFKVLDDAVSDVSGDVAVSIWPAIQEADSPADEALINYTTPALLIQLTESTGFRFDLGNIMTLTTIKGAEVV